MIDRQAVKTEAKQNMSGKKPSVFLVAAIYLAIFTVLSALLYSISGYEKFVSFIQQIMLVNPYPTYEEASAAIPSVTLIAGLLMLVILMTQFVLEVGFMGYCLRITRHEETDIKVLLDGFALFGKIIVLELLQIIFVFLWSLLFIVPGIIAYYSYRQAFYILLDNPAASPVECIRQSKRIMAGYKLSLLFLDFSFIGWLILDQAIRILAVLPVFSIWLAPYTGTARAGFYTHLLSGGISANEAE
jgi:uncharacterized membrane protein